MSYQPKFDSLRIQLFFPCAAECQWCRTFLKNPSFARLHKTGKTQTVNDFYLSALERYKPRRLYISGGEASLMPNIGEFLRQASPHVERIFLYCSFQFPERILSEDIYEGVDPEKLHITHSVIHFFPDKWHEFTNGFPHDRYVANLRLAKALPYKKCIKFVLNHDDFEAEYDLFQRLVEPDNKFEFRVKLMNEQNNGFGAKVMQSTKEAVTQRLLGRFEGLEMPDENIVAGVSSDEILNKCRYRFAARELRFAFWRDRADGVCLKVRFCPYFGSDTFHKFVVGKQSLDQIDHWFLKGDYRNKCDSCRLLHYSNGASGAVAAPQLLDA